MVSPERGTAGAAGNGAAVSHVTRTGASRTGRNESQSGPRRRPRGHGPAQSGELKAQRAQSRGKKDVLELCPRSFDVFLQVL